MFDYVKMLKKGILALFVGLCAVILDAIIKAIGGYTPVICSDVITENCTSQILATAYMAIIPSAIAVLTMVNNWIKNRNKVM